MDCSIVVSAWVAAALQAMHVHKIARYRNHVCISMADGTPCGRAPGFMSMGSARSPERTSGPLVSSMMATLPRSRRLYSRTRSTTALWLLWSPCDMFSRATFIPCRTNYFATVITCCSCQKRQGVYGHKLQVKAAKVLPLLTLPDPSKTQSTSELLASLH
jgi:hypothetical protein